MPACLGLFYVSESTKKWVKCITGLTDSDYQGDFALLLYNGVRKSVSGIQIMGSNSKYFRVLLYKSKSKERINDIHYNMDDPEKQYAM